MSKITKKTNTFFPIFFEEVAGDGVAVAPSFSCRDENSAKPYARLSQYWHRPYRLKPATTPTTTATATTTAAAATEEM
jgi:hypothetical protein